MLDGYAERKRVTPASHNTSSLEAERAATAMSVTIATADGILGEAATRRPASASLAPLAAGLAPLAPLAPQAQAPLSPLAPLAPLASQQRARRLTSRAGLAATWGRRRGERPVL